MSKMMRVATDVGGTFTDLVYCKANEAGTRLESIIAKKVHTTPPNFEEGVINAVEAVGIDLHEVAFFSHGSTVVINAFTERKGAKTALITTEGFRDILEIGRGTRPDFFNLRYAKPKPFVPRYLRREVSERVTFDGVVSVPLDLSGLPKIIADFKADNIEAIGVCLLHAYANPKHEKQLVDEIKCLWPEVAVVASHQITREWREYERTNTTVLSAYVQPITSRYLDQLNNKLRDQGLEKAPFIMQSNGGIDTVEASKQKPIALVESGPASGVLACAALGKLLNEPNIIAFDVGGTTAKCALIHNGEVQITSNYIIEKNKTSAGYPIMTPVVDLVEIGNGGGSIAWVDDEGKLHVGPQSAGANPGPAAYGKGGTDATTTDANILTGRIDPNFLMGGAMQADMDSVNSAFSSLGDKLNLQSEEVARGVIRIANNNMINALKLVSINRGFDPRDFTLVAFGGGGAMHAPSLAVELNIPKVIVPENSAVFSAWGMLLSDLRKDYILTKLTALDENAPSTINSVFGELESQAELELQEDGIDSQDIYFERYGMFRYSGQEHTVRVRVPNEEIDDKLIADITADFQQRFEQEYSYRLDNAVELVGYQLVSFGRVDKPELPIREACGSDLYGAVKATRTVDFDVAGLHESTIYDREKLEPGMIFDGPAIVEEDGTTTVVPPGQQVSIDQYGNMHIAVDCADKGSLS